jgi:uncharacterized protein (DUF2235 family)
MSKSIVVCIDGTNNGPTKGRTNVSRFFRILDKSNPNQVGYYQPGVGTLDPDSPSGWLKHKIRRVKDLASAAFFSRHVTSAYRYLMQVYEPGDQIYLIGFSRGAYTCRVLAGMLHKVGLLHRGQEEMIPFAWEVYRQKKNERSAGRFKKYYSHKIEVSFIGIWDTVSSIGSRLCPQTFPSTFDNPSVRCVRHAVALDERRATYGTNLWTESTHNGQSVEQVWFPGVHADIGGGYSGDEQVGLGAIPLKWMIREANSAGLRFLSKEESRLIWRDGGNVPEDITVEAITERYIGSIAHDELSSDDLCGVFWRLIERMPLPRNYRNDDGVWVKRWRAHNGRYRYVPDHTKIHHSVLKRKEIVPEYQPENILEPLDESQVCW